MTVRELFSRMDAVEFGEWAAFNIVEPIGLPADNLNTAKIIAAVINAAGGLDGKAVSPEDYLPADDLPPKNPEEAESSVSLDDQFRKVFGNTIPPA